ncbi:hypothetical protein IscW_ISCW024882, partial [Ixodes scapularis]
SHNETDFSVDGHVLYRAKHTGVDTDRSENSILPAYGPQAFGLTRWINTKLPQCVCDVWVVSIEVVKAVLLLTGIVLEKNCCFQSAKLFELFALVRWSPTPGPRARFGPRKSFDRPALAAIFTMEAGPRPASCTRAATGAKTSAHKEKERDKQHYNLIKWKFG